jgi:hypothetical protein
MTVTRMRGGSGTISHPFLARDPKCPDTPHPTRWCGCKVFRTETAAHEYEREQGWV